MNHVIPKPVVGQHYVQLTSPIAGGGGSFYWNCHCLPPKGPHNYIGPWQCGNCGVKVEGGKYSDASVIPKAYDKAGQPLPLVEVGEQPPPDPQPVTDWPNSNYGQAGCEACNYFMVAETDNGEAGSMEDYFDPCSGDGPYTYNDQCAHMSYWKSAGAPLWVGGNAIINAGWYYGWGDQTGCEACNWYNTVKNPGMMGPCSGGTGKGCYPEDGSCAALPEWQAAGSPTHDGVTLSAGPQPSKLTKPVPKGKGCQACLWYAHKTGLLDDMCSHGNPDAPNPGCFYFGTYMKRQGFSAIDTKAIIKAWKAKQVAALAAGTLTPEQAEKLEPVTKGEQRRAASLRKFKLLEGVDYTSTSDDWTGHSAEHATGQQFGLNVKLDLAQMCAEFYVLEAMFTDMFQWDGGSRYQDSAGKWHRPGMYMPKSFSVGNSMDVARAYDVQKRMQTLENRLAEQFSTYLQIACGGEFRHFTHRGSSGDEVKEWHCEHECDGKCCTHKCEYWPEEHFADMACGCKCKHAHTCDLDGCDVDECCAHVCSLEQKCWHLVAEKQVINDRLRKYLDKCGGGERTAGWKHWRTLSKRNPAVWMQDLSRGFLEVNWKGGYGGVPWGRAAEICAGYLAGDISTRTFIDRCWSMQHHGGHIFNKFYFIDQLRRADGNGTYLDPETGENQYRLDYILNLQAKSEYDELARFAGHGVGGLWWDFTQRKTRDAQKQAFVTSLVERSTLVHN